ncbi:MAG: ABC transporter substrate-binding protein [Desulfobacteraceae bacterium]|nr:ABC transporter substrate-binding protein [Desulfobacteraceae bacterium]
MIDFPHIRIGHLKIFDHLILGLAHLHLEQGFETLSRSILEPLSMNAWLPLSESLLCQDIDGAFLPAPLAMDLFASGLDIRLLMFTHRNGSVIVKSKAPEIKTMAGFKGKTVLVPAEFSIQNMFLHRLLSSAGLSFGTHDQKTVDVAREIVPSHLMADMAAADSDQDIAGFAVEEPFASDAQKKGLARRICTTGSLWKNHPGSVFVLRTSFIEQYPEAVKEMISLFVRTAGWIEDNKNEALLSLASLFLEQDREMIRHILFKTDLTYDIPLLVPDPEALNIIQEYMTGAMGVMTTGIDVNRLIDSSFILETVSENHIENTN